MGHRDLYGKLKEVGLIHAYDDCPFDEDADPFGVEGEGDLIITEEGWLFNLATEEVEPVCADDYFWFIDGDDEDGRKTETRIELAGERLEGRDYQ